MTALIDLTGQRFGRLQVLHRGEKHHRKVYWLVRCDCGAQYEIMTDSLLYQHTQSCQSCWYTLRRTPANKTFAGYHRREHNSWKTMMGRCQNPKWCQYRLYGGRGIHVSPELSTFEGFYAVLGDRPPNTSLDRIDSNGNYESGNVRWASPIVQGNNSRSNRHLTIDGQTHTHAEWARILGITRDAFDWRLEHGLPLH